jgi:hypothetical protein
MGVMTSRLLPGGKRTIAAQFSAQELASEPVGVRRLARRCQFHPGHFFLICLKEL